VNAPKTFPNLPHLSASTRDILIRLVRNGDAACQAHDWPTAAEKFEQALAIEPNLVFLQERLQNIRQKLQQAGDTVPLHIRPPQPVSSETIHRLRMYNYLRDSINRLMRQTQKQNKR
jgi:hypothetical protein